QDVPWKVPSMQRPFTAGCPYCLQVEITSSCNLKCKMCRLTLGETITSLQPAHMEEVVWHRVLEAARRAAVVWVIGYGEPTLNPRFLQMLQDLDRLGVAIVFATNGISLRQELVAQLAKLRHLAHVNVSIDS